MREPGLHPPSRHGWPGNWRWSHFCDYLRMCLFFLAVEDNLTCKPARSATDPASPAGCAPPAHALARMEVVAFSDNLWMGIGKTVPRITWVFLPAQHADHVEDAGLTIRRDTDVAVIALHPVQGDRHPVQKIGQGILLERNPYGDRAFSTCPDGCVSALMTDQQ